MASRVATAPRRRSYARPPGWRRWRQMSRRFVSISLTSICPPACLSAGRSASVRIVSRPPPACVSPLLQRPQSQPRPRQGRSSSNRRPADARTRALTDRLGDCWPDCRATMIVRCRAAPIRGLPPAQLIEIVIRLARALCTSVCARPIGTAVSIKIGLI
jgi:hypothetical protein